ncbi:MAG: ribonuclease III [Epsilonproteobacteria bacterium]|nr:ribonuclease III [Campylobacterota bacterium]OIO17065.1 MAG: ribonuclease III [Helicobacteraceae bacterium CG1_02_36_14]PIP09223.1 MAG: ribonuclease III [Sulfurimonas sp. CG23_combo_of_CG06-09_8_20_14_all_36_33]PIS24636.1 MAG: ribonuclease III [Sulfurimonas sp. CG08_land_8_20_14_0_20_36_33]PIU34985.1 MAG: ribonuclease III [Sulfurimonas sp. CG07_land_8_20_14_0_80_36_56]PIV02965.1 MAG: ribonuclease III [Sulfurimonas sp. CG03_land_8_20_14_0_80_36_25]PIV36729.1 MAG: ribonuclease III [Sulfurimo
MSKKIELLEKTLGYEFTDKKLIIEALTHKSYKQPYDNERLEFLGDAVLDLIVGEYLYKKFSKSAEGKLSKIRASLVNETGFDKLARSINIGDYILLSNAEENNGGREKASLLSNAFEAVMGAIYLEAGLKVANDIAIDLIEKNHKEISLDYLFRDYKTTLQELTQARFGVTPEYKVIASRGPDHLKEFEVAVFIEDKEYARAVGKSKKIAQQESAELAVELLKQEK